jgi:hypothetical protein
LKANADYKGVSTTGLLIVANNRSPLILQVARTSAGDLIFFADQKRELPVFFWGVGGIA